MSSRGAVAAGHPPTAEAGARVLRGGGNPVDAAGAAVLTSFVAESPLTGPGAGGGAGTGSRPIGLGAASRSRPRAGAPRPGRRRGERPAGLHLQDPRAD